MCVHLKGQLPCCTNHRTVQSVYNAECQAAFVSCLTCFWKTALCLCNWWRRKDYICSVLIYMHKAVTQNDVTLWLRVNVFFPYFVQWTVAFWCLKSRLYWMLYWPTGSGANRQWNFKCTGTTRLYKLKATMYIGKWWHSLLNVFNIYIFLIYFTMLAVSDQDVWVCENLYSSCQCVDASNERMLCWQ